MNSLWGSFFEHLTRCGHNASLFIISLAALVVLVVAAAIIQATHVHRYLLPLLPGLALLALWRACVLVRRARVRQRERLRFSPLSRDEMRVARSKLVKERI
jgi:4-amino-4-deoxy-L-arabinose transferase-like glycosyltransferase